MIDINTIISQALAAAVQQALQPLQQEYANKMGQMAQQIAALDTHLAEAIDRIAALETRIAALENNPAQGVDTTLERLDDQAWFWDKIRRFTNGAVEQAIEQHCEEYDHDDMLMSDALPDMDDYVTKDEMRDEVSDAVRDLVEGATVSIRL